MKPFHSNLGAAGWVERNAAGPCSVLVVQAKGRTMKLETLKVTYANTGDPIRGAQPVEVKR